MKSPRLGIGSKNKKCSQSAQEQRGDLMESNHNTRQRCPALT